MERPIRLRLTEDADLDFVLMAEQAEENRPFVGQWTRKQHQDALRDADHEHLILERCLDRKRVGYAILQGLQDSNRTIQLRRLVVTEKGQGYGRTALQMLKQKVFDQIGAHRLWLDVKDFNERAFSLYQSEGFVVEGTLRECEKVGDRYESLILLSLLEQEWRSVTAPTDLNSLP